MKRNVELAYSFGRDKLTDKTKHLAEGTLLLLTREGQRNIPPAATATLHASESYAEGRTNSAQGVWFADMQTQSVEGEAVVSRPVAIKPIGPAWLATKEVKQAELLNTVGTEDYPDVAVNPITFTPIGLLNDNGRIATVTAFEPAVTSFDNTLWRREQASPPSDQAIQTALSYSATSLIFLHANQFVHGDAQVKNTAYDGVAGRIVDITTTKKRSNMHGHHTEYMDDLSTYVKSVAAHKEFNHVSTEQLEAWFVDYYKWCVRDIYPEETQDIVHMHLDGLLQNYDQLS